MAEKFSVFTEAKSGVNPFYVIPYAPSHSAAPVALLRGLLAAALLSLLLPLEALATALDGLHVPLGSALRQLLCRPLAGAVLLCLGLGVQQQEVRKESLALRPPASRAAAASQQQQGGELLVVNRCSYLDALVLLSARGAGMAQLAANGQLARQPLWQALAHSWRAGAAAPAPAQGSASVLASLQSPGASWAVLAIQPEGAPTNGKAILSLQSSPGLAVLAAAAAAAATPLPRLRLLGLHYSSTGDSGRFSPCYLGHASPLWHAYCLLTHGSASECQLASLPPAFDPIPSDFPAATAATEWPAALVHALEQLLKRWGVRGVSADASKHAEFVALALGLGGKKAA